MPYHYTQPLDKDFYDSYYSLLPALKKLGLLAQLVSALTEYGVIYTLALQSVHTPLLAHLLAAMGTLFIEVGLRKFLPYSFRALLYKRYRGLHLTLSLMVFAVAALLLFTSALLSFHGSKHIVVHFSATPVPPVDVHFPHLATTQSLKKHIFKQQKSGYEKE